MITFEEARVTLGFAKRVDAWVDKYIHKKQVFDPAEWPKVKQEKTTTQYPGSHGKSLYSISDADAIMLGAKLGVEVKKLDDKKLNTTDASATWFLIFPGPRYESAGVVALNYWNKSVDRYQRLIKNWNRNLGFHNHSIDPQQNTPTMLTTIALAKEVEGRSS